MINRKINSTVSVDTPLRTRVDVFISSFSVNQAGHYATAKLALQYVLRPLERQRGQKVRLIVGDTLARLSAGANENAGQDMGLVVRRFDRIRTECKAHFLLIHHSGKAQANGARGWSGIRAAVDTEIEISDSPAGRCVEITKQRDLAKVKAAKGRLRPEQAIFLERINDAGGVAFVARDCRDVLQALRLNEDMQ